LFESYVNNARDNLILSYFYGSKFGSDANDIELIDQMSTDMSEVLFLKVDLDLAANKVLNTFLIIGKKFQNQCQNYLLIKFFQLLNES
jgi:hypothetical protein